ncbi:Cilia- and flagella-associated protein 57 [Chytriomyces hyalinus]|nr:Cilia- and flagella-associated protein 57 [Chytriomyces hyalinus]
MSIASVSHHRVFGITPTICKDNIYYIDESTIIYPVGCNAVVADIDQKSQKFVPCSDRAEAITAFSVSTDRHMFAVAEKTTAKPLIAIYDLHSYRRRKSLNPTSESQGLSKEFMSIAFSSDTRYIVAQLGAPEWILHYYAWEKGKLLGTVAVNPPKSVSKKGCVVECGICPTDGCQLSVLGDSFLRIYRYLEGGLSQAYEVSAQEQESFQSHAWLTSERVAVGTSNARILILSGSAILQTLLIDPARAGAPTPSITVLRSTVKGFLAAGQFGTVDVFERNMDPSTKNETYTASFKIPIHDDAMVVRTMTVSGTEASLILLSDTNAMHKVQLSGADVKQGADVKFEAAMPAFHYGAITGMDICIRKPLIITCSNDRTVRIWNYITGECELCKHFPEEASSVAIHPSGLYILVGFGDKLRLMNVLIDDVRLFKEFSIRSCRECRFSNGGHVFAAAYGNMIQLYSVWTFENYANLKGHNGKVRSLYWTPDDALLVSAGSDGAVYSWITKDLKRDAEYILKNCSYTSAVCTPDGKAIYAVGSDRLLKEITDSAITCQLDGNEVLTEIAISNSGRMMVVGTGKGAIRSMKFPLTGENEDYQEHKVHSQSVTKFRISSDDQYLFSCSEDGSVFMFKMMDRNDRGMKKEKTMVFSDEILITKSDLEEKTILMSELQRSLEELKLEHEYQLRLKDMNFNEKLKELTEKYSQEIEALKISTSVLRAEKEKEEVKQEEEMQNLKGKHLNQLHEVEAKYNQELMEEYEKYQSMQSKSSNQQEQWQRTMKEHDLVTQRTLAASQKDAEERLAMKQQEIQKLNEQINTQLQECQEIGRQSAEDIDQEIHMLQTRYEKRLRNERDEGARLKGENGIMRKKFSSLSKDIDDNKAELARMREDEKKLKSVIAMLEREIAGFKKEMSERDELIQDKERRVYELKKKNQELEKYKFVLDYRIKELKEQVEPRETEITVMTDQIADVNKELAILHKLKLRHEEEIKVLEKDLATTKQEYSHEHRKLHSANQTLRQFRTELHTAVQHIQDPSILKVEKRAGGLFADRSKDFLRKQKSMENLIKKHCSRDAETLSRVDVEADVKEEYMRQNESLLQEIKEHRKKTAANMDAYRLDGILSMVDNQQLLEEIATLRKMVKFSGPIKTKQFGKVGASNAGRQEATVDTTRLPSLPNANGIAT